MFFGFATMNKLLLKFGYCAINFPYDFRGDCKNHSESNGCFLLYNLFMAFNCCNYFIEYPWKTKFFFCYFALEHASPLPLPAYSPEMINETYWYKTVQN